MNAAPIDFRLLKPDLVNSFSKGMEEAQDRQNMLAALEQERQIKDATLQNKLREYQYALGEQEAIRGSKSFEDMQSRLLNAGYGKEAISAQNSLSNLQNSQINTAKYHRSLLENAATRAMLNPASAKMELLKLGQQTGQDVSPELAELESFGGDLDKIREWAAGHALKAKQLLPQFKTLPQAGGGVQAGTVDWKGQYTPTGGLGMPSGVPGVGVPGQMTQAELTRLYGKAQKGMKWTNEGNLEEIPGGGEDAKRINATTGKQDVSKLVSDLGKYYDTLDKNNAIVSQKKSGLENLSARLSSGEAGQFLGGALGTQSQTARDAIAQARPLLLQAIKNATGMSAKQMDSNAELKMYLAAATDPKLSLEANKDALKRLDELYGLNLSNGSLAAPNKTGTSSVLKPPLPPEMQNKPAKSSASKRPPGVGADWKMVRDADGNRAWASPDMKSFVEIK